MRFEQGRAWFLAGRGSTGTTVWLRSTVDRPKIPFACEPIVGDWFGVPPDLLRFVVMLADEPFPKARCRVTPDPPPQLDPTGLTLTRRSDGASMYLQAFPDAVMLLWQLNNRWGHPRARPLFIGWEER